MPEKTADNAAAHQIELVIQRLDSLSTLPCVAAQFFSKFREISFLTPEMDEIIESDAALAARILLLAHQQGLNLAEENFSICQVLDKLPASVVRDAVLSVRVFGGFGPEHGPDGYRDLPRKQLALHNLAVACCAKDIAEVSSPAINPELAYLAGLLHDIGKLAVDQEMPKTFERIVKEAKSQKASICPIEQKYLGLDHTILGKRLAQKWHLPNEIMLAIWLHHGNTVTISQNMPEAKIAQVVQLADLIARQYGIGQSGSYDSPALAPQIVQSLSITAEQMQLIRRSLAEKVAQKSKILGLDMPNLDTGYCDIVHSTASELASDNTKLTLENRRLQAVSHQFNFITGFLSNINSITNAGEAAEKFAVGWQKFYQTGPVCLYLIGPGRPQFLDAVVVENTAQTKVILLNAPAESAPIPAAVSDNFDVADVQNDMGWLFEQLDVEFDLGRTRLVPLLSGSKAVGAIVFELRHPAEKEKLRENFKMAASIAGSVLDTAFSWQQQQRLAEQFVQLVAGPKEIQPAEGEAPAETGIGQEFHSDSSLAALAEMAAGAAHELNNPLSVISGRAQLLSETEADPERKRILKQIQENTGEISQIIDELMSFARPQLPKRERTDIKQMLDEAVQLAALKTNMDHVNVQIEIAGGTENVFADSTQVVPAIANIISNSIESYSGNLGPVSITTGQENSGSFVKLAVSDLGCGMDAQTLQKATQPFFSAKPAGRKRGMGLAYASRLIQLNGGSLEIESSPGKGTTVTVLLRSA